MKLKHIGFLLVVSLLIGLTGCFEKNDFSKQGVCVLENASLRSEPTKKGQWLSALALGETMRLEGDAVKDPTDPNTEYIKVKLSDGTSGFANTYCIVRGAYVAVIQEEARIYKRPDLLAESESKFELMQIVAVEEEKEDWLRVTGEKRTHSGWILKESIRKDKEDIVTAVLLKKAMRGKEATMNKEELDKILAKLPYPDNYFAIKMIEKYEAVDLTTPVQPATENPVPADANAPQ